MFERFTDRARRVVVLAQEEARLLGHSYIGTEHLLLALLNDQAGDIVVPALNKCGLVLDKTRTRVEEIVGRGDGPHGGHIPFTPRHKRVLELAMREALQLSHSYIGPEHLLLGLTRYGEGVAVGVIKESANLNDVRRGVLELLVLDRRSITVASAGAARRTEADIRADIDVYAIILARLKAELEELVGNN